MHYNKDHEPNSTILMATVGRSLELTISSPVFENNGFIPVKYSCDGENSAPGIQGKNGLGGNKYLGPCPPSGTHHYFFKVYALDTFLNVTSKSSKKEIEKAMEGHVLAKGQLIGLFKKEEKILP